MQGVCFQDILFQNITNEWSGALQRILLLAEYMRRPALELQQANETHELEQSKLALCWKHVNTFHRRKNRTFEEGYMTERQSDMITMRCWGCRSG